MFGSIYKILAPLLVPILLIFSVFSYLKVHRLNSLVSDYKSSLNSLAKESATARASVRNRDLDIVDSASDSTLFTDSNFTGTLFSYPKSSLSIDSASVAKPTRIHYINFRY